MPRLFSYICVLVPTLLLMEPKAVPGAESVAEWADPALPVREDLLLWLDATRREALLDEAGKPVEKSGAPVAAWLDASPARLKFEQPAAASRPQLDIEEKHRAVRFGGKKTFLQAKDDRSLNVMTIFIATAPHDNTGGYRGMMATSESMANDYVTGFTLDFGPYPSREFAFLNYEGSGAPRVKNIKPHATPFGRMHRLTVTSTAGDEGVKLRVNGAPAGTRDRADKLINSEAFTVGCRYYNNGGPPEPTGFFQGDIAEILIFKGVLDDKQIEEVEKYLAGKHGDMRKVTVPEPPGKLSYIPDVQVFVPGFRVRELPIELTNINNLKYRADGKLLALAYDGNAYLLSDADGDGLEDRAELFWDNQGRLQSPIGMALTPPNYPDGNGFFVASKGYVSLIADTDGDDRADRQVIVSEGWKEIVHRMDALGIAYDSRDGSLYFGLGTEDFTNAYLPDGQGNSRYDVAGERGTILRFDPKTKQREIVCTGIRFPVALAFNGQHDLFCTDQEGATWLPNGNPFDELLHIQPKRHYGFPPRHPRYLPDVIDEPSVCDYSPQHQSTCGLNFNEPVNGGPVFGPSHWQGDAIVCGYARGKLYRTQLVKSSNGYISRNHLLASLNKLACDACVSPTGDLVIATHSGGPDWGSGPRGKGKLYNVRCDQPELPQPVAVWPHNAREVHVAFDRPLEPGYLNQLQSGMKLQYGKYVAAGDRFEAMRPGYQTVIWQMEAPREDLPILGVGVTPDRRTLVISTAPHPQAVNYALTIPALGRPKQPKPGDIKQYAETDLAYDLGGVDVEWQSTGGAERWHGWLPHIDLEVAKQFTAGSAAHDQFWNLVHQPGLWTMKTSLNLSHMLRPAVQPGSKLDATLPPEKVTLELRSMAPLQVEGTAFINVASTRRDGMHVTTLELAENHTGPAPLTISFASSSDPRLTIAFRTDDDSRLRALALSRFMVPWSANLETQSTEPAERSLPPQLAGGNWSRGKKVFFGEEAGCSKCHKYGGVGESVGPDLSNLPHRDYASVLRDIEQPSFAINPDHLSHNITLNDGRTFSGLIRHDGKQLLITDTQARTIAVAQDEVDEIVPSAKSIMPEGLPKLLGPERIRDLLTFLLTPAPSMPLDGPEPPSARSRAEVEAVLSGAPPASDSPARPLNVVLVAGKKDHGPGEHDYPAWQKAWSQLFSMADGVQVSTAMDWPSSNQFRSADLIVIYQQGKWTAERAAAVDAFLARGGGLVLIHYAVDGGADPLDMSERIGLAWQGGHSKFRHGPLTLEFRDLSHPIARNLSSVNFHDESYWQLVGDPSRITRLATGLEDGRQQPLLWTVERGKGRVFVSIPGHYSWTFDDPLFRVILLRGTAWAANEPVDRFNDLVYPGARLRTDELLKK